MQVVLDSCFRRSDGFPDFLCDHQNEYLEKSKLMSLPQLPYNPNALIF